MYPRGCLQLMLGAEINWQAWLPGRWIGFRTSALGSSDADAVRTGSLQANRWAATGLL